MPRYRRTGYFLLLLVAGAVFSPAQDFDPREIDGAKNPEKIPDRYAYPALFRRLLGDFAESGRRVFQRDSGLSEADSAAVFRAAERFTEFETEGFRQLNEARKSALRPLPPAVLDQYRVWNERMVELVEDIQRRFEREVSPAGQNQLRHYLLNSVKRSMSVHLGDADIASGLGGATVPAGAASARVKPSVPRPPPLDPIAVETGMAEASKALAVLRYFETEHATIIELWNGSPKPIAAFVVAICAPSLSQKAGLDSFGQARQPIAPGATHQLDVAKGNRPRCGVMTPKAVAVIFDDDTSAGLATEVEWLRTMRLKR